MCVDRLRGAAARPAGGREPSLTATFPWTGLGFHLYWGDLHRHSLVSRCTSGDEPSLEDFYRYAWDVNEYDFWAVTDHAENSTAYQWWSIQKIADLLHVPGRFVPLYGFEWTSAEHGHQNVIYGDVARGAPIFSAFAEGSTTPDGLWRGLAAHPQFPAITIPHHPGSAMVHNDWDYHDPGFSRLVEVFQACRGNYESETCFRQYSDGTATGTFMLDGLRRGHRFGLIASSDHGHGASYVAVLARSLSPCGDLRGFVVAPHLRCHDPRRARRPPARAAPDGRGARVARCPAADRARPRLHRTRPDRHPAGRPDRARAARRAAAAAGPPPGRPQGGMGAGGHDDLLGRAAVGGGRPARAARPRRPRGRGHGLPPRGVAARHAQLRRALRGAARWRRGQRLRARTTRR